ncbi:aldehyde dehydrogenase-like protein [Morchella conica CCBAS932]|uniref:aldehyde dehydrogenase (NAD(+)) n=1 Tax=Morchella conica CCBAS932 TaxID=1392247 RepID=A0A3N4KLF8_9PEZI|nr:aldehyde dehydrogenase-like protein [Morchella conica CCBAS932]
MTLPLFKELTAPNGKKFNQPLGLFINNEFVKSQSGKTLTTISPTDETEITDVYAADAADVDIAVKAARAAFLNPAWCDISPAERGQLLYKLADLVQQHEEQLATIETWDMGKPYTVAKAEDLAESVNVFKYYAGWADKVEGRTIDTGPNKLAYTLHQPVGVCGQSKTHLIFTKKTYNNRFNKMAAWKLAPALACGNTVVLKSAEQTPLSALYLAQLVKEAGFPPGVVNVLTGYGKTAGAAIAGHEDVDKIAFTGSTATARHIMKAASVNLKNITLETGGKSPLIIFEDADLEQAVKWGHVGIMHNMGQVCTATSRILVHESVYSQFIEKFKKETAKVSVVGDPFSEKTFQGPQVSKQQHERILEYIEHGKAEGATLVSGGTPHGEKGFFVAPTIFADVKAHHKINQEEVFGPFVVIDKFSTQEEAISRANGTQYGLGASIFTKDITRAHRVAAKLDAGMVWINSSNDSHYAIPFGGVKQSGIGRELGQYALSAYTNAKAVHVNLGTVL